VGFSPEQSADGGATWQKEKLIGGANEGSPVVDCGSRSNSGPQGSLRKQLRGRRRTVESHQWRALLLNGNRRGGAPLSASTNDFPCGWEHGMKRWTVLKVDGDEQRRAKREKRR
jgi:hypothetical protein